MKLSQIFKKDALQEQQAINEKEKRREKKAARLFGKKTFADKFSGLAKAANFTAYLMQVLSFLTVWAILEVFLKPLGLNEYLCIILAFGIAVIIELFKHTLSKITYYEILAERNFVPAVFFLTAVVCSVSLSLLGSKRIAEITYPMPAAAAAKTDSINNFYNAQIKDAKKAKESFYEKHKYAKRLPRKDRATYSILTTQLSNLVQQKNEAIKTALENTKSSNDKTAFEIKQRVEATGYIIAIFAFSFEMLYLLCSAFLSYYYFSIAAKKGLVGNGTSGGGGGGWANGTSGGPISQNGYNGPISHNGQSGGGNIINNGPLNSGPNKKNFTNCLSCGDTLKQKRSDAAFCSLSCKNEYHNKKRVPV